MLDDRFVFVASALFAIGMWIALALRHRANLRGQPPYLHRSLIVLLCVVLCALLIFHTISRLGMPHVAPSVGTLLAVILGGAVGSFSARFVWSLFGARFGARDPIVGVLVLLLLIIVYTLPIYRNEVSTLLGHLNLSSVKTPGGFEFTFADRAQFRTGIMQAKGATGAEQSAAIPRPNDPRPGLDNLRELLDQTVSYLQPYIVMVLADLLVAHGSPDEAVEVLTQWLDVWRCARRGDEVAETALPRCPSPALPAARELPDWFSIRAEFAVSTLLYELAGEANIAYHDFLQSHAAHFQDYTSNAISIKQEHQRCIDKNKVIDVDRKDGLDSKAIQSIRSTILRSLLQNENTLLRSDLHFLVDMRWDQMENLLERARILSEFRIECITLDGAAREGWESALDDYKITAGLLGLAVADRVAIDGDSADARNRADEMRRLGRDLLFTGYRRLKEVCERQRTTFANSLRLSKRVFRVSPWEASCSLAERAIYRLRDLPS